MVFAISIPALLGLKWLTNLISMLSFIVLTATLIAIWRQMCTQNRMYESQLLLSQMQVYTNMNPAISEDQIKEVKLYPNEFMGMKAYLEKYKDDRDKTHKFIWMMQNYEYLAYCYLGYNELNSKQTGFNEEAWLDELIKVEEFIDVHKAQGVYYPKFKEHVDKRIAKSRPK